MAAVTLEELISEAKVVAARNASGNLQAVAIGWDASIGELRMDFYLAREISDEDQDLCEQASGEMSAACPDIRRAELAYIRSWRSQSEIEQLPGLVYLGPLAKPTRP